jgi:hypothetical protein
MIVSQKESREAMNKHEARTEDVRPEDVDPHHD